MAGSPYAVRVSVVTALALHRRMGEIPPAGPQRAEANHVRANSGTGGDEEERDPRAVAHRDPLNLTPQRATPGLVQCLVSPSHECTQLVVSIVGEEPLVSRRPLEPCECQLIRHKDIARDYR